MVAEASPGDEGTAPFGLVLAGGLARRLAGRDKALMRLDGSMTLLDVLLARLGPQCSRIGISANGDPARFAATGLPVLGDPPGPSRGPLAGVLAGLDRVSGETGGTWLLTVPGDTPFVPADLVSRLTAAARATGRPVARATCGDRRHALVALWSGALGARLREALLGRDLRKVTAFQAEVGVVDVPWEAAPHDPFFNINTPDDLEAARRIQETVAHA